MKNLCENSLSICFIDGDYFILTNKESGKEIFRDPVKENPQYALALHAKWGYKLCKGITEKDLLK